GVLLLGHVALLLLPLLLHLLLLFHVPAAPHHAEHASHAGADGRALSRVAPNRAAHRPERRSPHGSPKHPALGGPWLRGVRRRGGGRQTCGWGGLKPVCWTAQP